VIHKEIYVLISMATREISFRILKLLFADHSNKLGSLSSALILYSCFRRGDDDEKERQRAAGIPEDIQSRSGSTGTGALAAGKPGSIGWREQRKVLVPVDTTGPGNGRDGLAPFSRTRTTWGGGTDPLAEGSYGVKDGE
jgi:hypothetical protein